jgi:anti-sigma regulatory factor (Ser/Thr protein kinase)
MFRMGLMDEHDREASFPLTREAPRSARHWLADSGMAVPALRDEAMLLMTELVSNSVVHSGLPASDMVRVHVSPITHGLRVEVVDGGVGFDAEAPRSRSSYGLRLVERTADQWGHSADPTRVWFEVTE